MRALTRFLGAVLALLLTVALGVAAFADAPVVPAETPVETPVETPAEAPVAETPVEAPLAETPPPAVAISAPETFELGLSQCPTLPAAIVPDDGSFDLKFMSSDSDVCKIALSTGVFKPYAEGTCTVRVYAVPTSKAVTAEPPASVEVAVTVTRDALLARVVQTGESTLSLLFTGDIDDIDLSLVVIVDEEGAPLTIASIGANPDWDDVADVTVAETLVPEKTYRVVLLNREISVLGKAAADVSALPLPTPNPFMFLTQVRTRGAQTAVMTVSPGLTQTSGIGQATLSTLVESTYTTVIPTYYPTYYRTMTYKDTPTFYYVTQETIPTVSATGSTWVTITGTQVTVPTGFTTFGHNTRVPTLVPTRTRGQ